MSVQNQMLFSGSLSGVNQPTRPLGTTTPSRRYVPSIWPPSRVSGSLFVERHPAAVDQHRRAVRALEWGDDLVSHPAVEGARGEEHLRIVAKAPLQPHPAVGEWRWIVELGRQHHRLCLELGAALLIELGLPHQAMHLP